MRFAKILCAIVGHCPGVRPCTRCGYSAVTVADDWSGLIVGATKVHSLGPEDTLVVRCTEFLSEDAATRIGEHVAKRCRVSPGRVLVLGKEMDLEVLRRTKERARKPTPPKGRRGL